jgi:hypothetical protein
MIYDDSKMLALLVKRGLLSLKATREQAYELEGKLVDDSFLFQRRADMPCDPEFPAMVDGMYEAIESLTAAELLGLKERVGIITPFRKA